jgi:hypothetical protein
MRFISDTLQTLIKGQVGEEFYPLPGVPHIRETKFFISHILQPCESAFKKIRYSIRERAAVSSAEIEIALIPLGIDVNNVVQPSILRRWLDMLWFQYGLDEMISFFLDIGLDTFRYLVLELFRREKSPDLLCHRIESLCERISMITILKPTQN